MENLKTISVTTSELSDILDNCLSDVPVTFCAGEQNSVEFGIWEIWRNKITGGLMIALVRK